MLSRYGSLGLAAVASAVLLSAPAGGAERHPQAASVEIVLSVNTRELDASFKSPWQVAWIPGGSKSGTIAFTDRGANQVGLLDPTNLRVQNVRLNNITSPGPIAVLDNTRFAVAGTGGVAVFDRSGTGKVTELVMANTRNQVLAVGPDNSLFVADAQQHDLRIIRSPYSGPADITKFPLPQQCRNPTGLVPGASTIDVLCQQTNNIVLIDYTGNFGSSTALPVANAGAQEARPSPNGFVFSAFNAGQVLAFSPNWRRQFRSFALTGPAVPTVGLFYDPASDRKLAEVAERLRTGRKRTPALFFNSFTPSFRNGSFSFGSFPAATSNPFTRLAGRNLVGSTNGPGGTIWVTDATPGKPALHVISFGDGTKTGRTKTGYRLSERLTQASPDFLARMTMPFFSAVPSEVRLGVTGASASPYNLKQSFSQNFNLKLAARAALQRGGTYQIKVQSADTGAYTRAYRFFGLRPGTKNLTFTFTGSGEIPASYKVDAVAEVKPCECKELFTRVVGARDLDVGRSGLRMDVVVTSILTCTNGTSSSGCKAKLEFSPTVGDRADGLRVEEGDANASCTAPCGNDNSQSHRVTLVGGTNFGSQRLGRSVRVISLEIEQECAGKKRSKIVDFVFRENGRIDYKRSDINGNGVPDEEDSR